MAVAGMYETALKRLAAAAATTPTGSDWAQVSLIIAATCAVSLPIGLTTSKSPICWAAHCNDCVRCTMHVDQAPWVYEIYYTKPDPSDKYSVPQNSSSGSL